MGDSGYDSQRRVLMLGDEGGSGGSGLGHGDATMEGAGGTAGATRASGGRSAQRSAPGASASGPRRTPPPARGGDGKREVPGQSAWGDKWKISHGIRNCFATGDPPVERLLRNRNGSISRNFLHISIKLTLGRGGGSGGPAWGTEEEMGRGEVPWQGVSRQKLASPTEISFLEGWRLLVA